MLQCWQCAPHDCTSSHTEAVRTIAAYPFKIHHSIIVPRTALGVLCPRFSPKLHVTESFLRTQQTLSNQEIPHILQNTKVLYRIHNSPPPFLILSQINPVHVSPSLFLKTRFNIIFSSTPRLSQRSLSFRYPNQGPVCNRPLRHTCHMPSPPQDIDSTKSLFESYSIHSAGPCSGAV